jgi:hypothetical protein
LFINASTMLSSRGADFDLRGIGSTGFAVEFGSVAGIVGVVEGGNSRRTRSIISATVF